MWLELHDSSGTVFVNMDTVTDFRRYEGNDKTQIFTYASSGDSFTQYYVFETPDEIINMITEEQERLANLTKTAR
ncbi:hypothetical protein AJ87_02845 [Rhizobium yanglingense]|nr:hypothetical protein AJ87_02845 [Rhizobium yanglingense]